jgi:hypothetical protein
VAPTPVRFRPLADLSKTLEWSADAVEVPETLSGIESISPSQDGILRSVNSTNSPPLITSTFLAADVQNALKLEDTLMALVELNAAQACASCSAETVGAAQAALL